MGAIRHLLHRFGFPGLVVILFLDSSGVPWPTEATLVVFGVAAAHAGGVQSLESLALSWLSGLLGAALGSSLSYYLGYKMGPSLMLRIMTFFRLTPQHLEKVDAWFTKHGHRAVFFGRLIPFVRNFSGYPAGVARMPFGKYLVFSLAGYGAYTAFALMLGYGGLSFARFVGRLEILAWIVVPLVLILIWLKWGRKWAQKQWGKG